MIHIKRISISPNHNYELSWTEMGAHYKLTSKNILIDVVVRITGRPIVRHSTSLLVLFELKVTLQVHWTSSHICMGMLLVVNMA